VVDEAPGRPAVVNGASGSRPVVAVAMMPGKAPGGGTPRVVCVWVCVRVSACAVHRPPAVPHGSIPAPPAEIRRADPMSGEPVAVEPPPAEVDQRYEHPALVEGDRGGVTRGWQRRPAHVLVRVAPVAPRGAPLDAGYPDPAVVRGTKPASVVEHDVAPGPLGLEGPSGVGVDPAAVGVVGLKIAPHHGARRLPDLSVGRDVHPAPVR
jgi:hypothetical protein